MLRGEIRLVDLDPVRGSEGQQATSGCDRQQRSRRSSARRWSPSYRSPATPTGSSVPGVTGRSRELAGQTEVTAAFGDVQGEASTDPNWVGGIVHRTTQGLRWAPHGLVQGVLLGLRRPDASV